MEKQITALGPKDRKSYVVTLPIDWVRANGLDKSRKADLAQAGSAIVIRPMVREVRRITIDAHELQHSLRRIIQILYKKGVDEIKIVRITPSRLAEIETILEQRCLGFTVIETGKNYCIIRDVAKESTEDFHALVRRLFFIVQQLTEETNAEQLQNLDKNLNKISAYCTRLLLKQGYGEFDKIYYYIMLCSELERLGDEWKRARIAKETIAPACSKLFKDLCDLYFHFTDKQFDKVTVLAQIQGKQRYETIIIRRMNTLLGMIYALQG